jgi:hypothetical protein
LKKRSRETNKEKGGSADDSKHHILVVGLDGGDVVAGGDINCCDRCDMFFSAKSAGARIVSSVAVGYGEADYPAGSWAQLFARECFCAGWRRASARKNDCKFATKPTHRIGETCADSDGRKCWTTGGSISYIRAPCNKEQPPRIWEQHTFFCEAQRKGGGYQKHALHNLGGGYCGDVYSNAHQFAEIPPVAPRDGRASAELVRARTRGIMQRGGHTESASMRYHTRSRLAVSVRVV